MSTKYWETPEFKSLQRCWYEKAAESGYKDVEYGEHTDIMKGLSGPSTPHQMARLQRKVAAQGYYETLDYYCRAKHWIGKIRAKRGATEKDKARAKRDREIYSLHSDAIGVRTIAKRMGVSPKTVERTIKRERARMLAHIEPREE